MLPGIMAPSSWGNTPQYTGVLEVLNRVLVAQYSCAKSPTTKFPTKTSELLTIDMIPTREYKQNASYLMDFVWDYFPSNILHEKLQNWWLAQLPSWKGCTSIGQEDTIPSLNCLAGTMSEHTRNICKICPRAKRGFWAVRLVDPVALWPSFLKQHKFPCKTIKL